MRRYSLAILLTAREPGLMAVQPKARRLQYGAEGLVQAEAVNILLSAELILLLILITPNGVQQHILQLQEG